MEASDQKYSGASYLSPKGKEPQQRVKHRSSSQVRGHHNSQHQSRSGHPSSAAHSFPAHTAVGTTAPTSSGQRDMSAVPRISDNIHRGITRHQYSQDNILQSYEVYIPEADGKPQDVPTGQKYWIIYIHGGYFRDPAVTSSSFYPALELLASEKHHQHHPHIFKHNGNSAESAEIKPYIAG